MEKITIKIEGMMCGMCESHINNAVRKAFMVKKVTSSHSKNITEIITENKINEEQIIEVINATGYQVISITREPYIKKGFLKSLFK